MRPFFGKIFMIGLVSFFSVHMTACQSKDVNDRSAEPSTEESAQVQTEEQNTNTSTSDVETEDTEKESLFLVTYFIDDDGQMPYLVREIHEHPYTLDVAEAAVNELISGKPHSETAFQPLPPETKINHIDITDGLATVDFSKEVLNASMGATSEALAIEAVVNTLTEFDSIERVKFIVDGSEEKAMNWWGHVGLYGQPFMRDLSNVMDPPIWADIPKAGDKVQNPLKLRASFMTFESTLHYELVDDQGNLLAEGYTPAQEQQGFRSFVELEIPFQTPKTPNGLLRLYELSGKDGSPVNTVEIPLVFE